MSTPTGPQDPSAEPNPYGQQPPAYGQQPPAYGQQPGYPVYAQGGYAVQPQGTPPPNYLVWAIISIFLCTIGGVIAIVYSTQVNSKWAAGDAAGAYAASKTAKTWCLVSTIVGILAVVGYVIAVVAGVAMSSTTTYGY